MEYELDTSGKDNTFEGGAIRKIKDKGRFDLIEHEVAVTILDEQYNTASQRPVYLYQTEILKSAYARKFTEVIEQLIAYRYHENLKDVNSVDPEMNIYTTFESCFEAMTKELAIHYQKGANEYGVRNCEKGIPLSSFIDSGIRHLTQYFLNEKGENHYIAAIWNFWMAAWTVMRKDRDENLIDDPESISLYLSK